MTEINDMVPRVQSAQWRLYHVHKRRPRFTRNRWTHSVVIWESERRRYMWWTPVLNDPAHTCIGTCYT